MQMLKTIRIAGWKSIKDQTLELTPLTVVIGANGAGKSNLLSLFKLLNSIFANTPGFRNYVALDGLASWCPNKKIGVTTVGEIRVLGYDVIVTVGKGYHATVVVPADWNYDSSQDLVRLFREERNPTWRRSR
jgi:energy-coupling factor transporter ATP-binding protein EcfA2